MTEIELLTIISQDIKTLISIVILFEMLKIGKGIYSMWKGGMRND